MARASTTRSPTTPGPPPIDVRTDPGNKWSNTHLMASPMRLVAGSWYCARSSTCWATERTASGSWLRSIEMAVGGELDVESLPPHPEVEIDECRRRGDERDEDHRRGERDGDVDDPRAADV